MKREKTWYAIKNQNGDFLNIRMTGVDGVPQYNSYKEKRFWITKSLAQAMAQSFLLATKGNGEHIVVKITEVSPKQRILKEDFYEEWKETK